MRMKIVSIASNIVISKKLPLEIIWNNYSQKGGLEKELDVNRLFTYIPVIPFIDGGCLDSNIQVAPFFRTNKKTQISFGERI
jgi:hypothetical protein